MKKLLSGILILTLMLSLSLSLSACGGETAQQTEDPESEAASSQTQTEMTEERTESENTMEEIEDTASEDTQILIAYFSKTGNTETIANMIAEQTGGELFKVETVTPYPEDYDETVDIAREEQDNDARPEISTHVEDMSQYDVICLGYPNWWGTMPQAMFTFLEEYDFSGKTIIPFCTHGGSALGRSEEDITNLAPDATLLDGLAVRDSSVDNAQETV